jgi:hypothetical protein
MTKFISITPFRSTSRRPVFYTSEVSREKVEAWRVERIVRTTPKERVVTIDKVRTSTPTPREPVDKEVDGLFRFAA